MDQAPTLRADAERNRQAILSAAAAVFARRGTDAPFDEVAREAGVGIATLYRRFPERADLIQAVFEEKMSRYADRAEATAVRARIEPKAAFLDYVEFILKEQATDPSFAEVLIAPLTGSPAFAVHHRRALVATTKLVEEVVAAGVVRSDFAHSDLYLLTLANAGLVRAARSNAAPASRRFAAYMLDAFLQQSTTPLPPTPAAWRRASRTGR